MSSLTNLIALCVAVAHPFHLALALSNYNLLLLAASSRNEGVPRRIDHLHSTLHEIVHY
jgi:hypothetical protein